MNCQNHKEKLAEYHCPRCQLYFCGPCVTVREISEQFTAYICRACGGKVDTLTQKKNKSFFKMEAGRGPIEFRGFFWELPGILIFPLKGGGPIFLLLFAALFYGVDWVLVRYHYGGLFVLTVTVTYFILFLFNISEDSARGSRAITGLPGVRYWVDFIEPSVYIGLSMLFCFAPLSIYFLMTKNFDIPFLLLGGIGMSFFPMAYITVLLMRRPDSHNPSLVIKATLKVFPKYFFMCSLMILPVVGQVFINTEYLAQMGTLGFALNQFMMVYIWVMFVRLLGIFARSLKESLPSVQTVKV